MTTNVGQIVNPQVLVRPSQKLLDYVSNIKAGDGDMPFGIKNIVFKNKPKGPENPKLLKPKYLTTSDDKEFIKSLNLPSIDLEEVFKESSNPSSTPSNNKLLDLADLHWLHKYISHKNKTSESKIYLHELMEGSEVVLPKNAEIPRNEELDKRCQRLKAEQQNREYSDMTKNVDSMRRKLPEDTIGFQIKMMNKHLIAVFQFVVSVISGFAFGFIGIELLVGSLEFGFRLLLGIMFALIVALADLYFLAKQLNEDLDYEYAAKKVETKID